MRFHDFIGPITIVLANVCFMGSFSLAKVAAVDTAIMVIMLFRFLAGPVILTPYIVAKKKPIKLTAWRLLGTRVCCGVLAMSALFAAFKHGDIGKSTLIFEFSILWTLIYDAVVEKRWPSRWSMMAIVGAFIGIIMIIKPGHLGTFYMGDMFAFIGSIFNAGVYVTLKKLRDRYDTVTVVFWTYTISSLVLLIPAAPYLSQLSISTLSILVFMCTLGLMGQVLLTLGFKFAPASISAMFMLSIVPLTTASGRLFFNEVHTSTTIWGMVLVGGSLLVIARWR